VPKKTTSEGRSGLFANVGEGNGFLVLPGVTGNLNVKKRQDAVVGINGLWSVSVKGLKGEMVCQDSLMRA
jgi:hypothetical protein